MKKLAIISIAIITIFFACSNKDNSTLVKADFEVSITGEAPNATLILTNKSLEADSYLWEFGEGASESSSTLFEPENINIEKNGEFRVSLSVQNGDLLSKQVQFVNITGFSSINTYTDIKFGLDTLSDYGRFWSFSTEEMYLDSLINDSTSSFVHIGFNYISNSEMQFISPDSVDFDGVSFTNPTHTDIDNFLEAPFISSSDFDTMETDSLLDGLNIENNPNEFFANSYFPHLVLIKLRNSKIGVIKVKTLNDDHIVVDMKIQKY